MIHGVREFMVDAVGLCGAVLNKKDRFSFFCCGYIIWFHAQVTYILC